MRAKLWLIGCILCIAGSGTAMASSRGGQDVDNSSRSVSDNSGSQRDGSGDITDLTAHNSAPRSTTQDNNSSTPSSSDHSTGGGGSAPPPVRQPHRGWQSLLPGSIQ
jgi:hypothetical protein